MSHSIAISPHMYGAIDLKSSARRHLTIAGLIAVAIHLIGVGSYWLTVVLGSDEAPVIHVRLFQYSELGTPPSIEGRSLPAAVSSTASARPAVGVPVPVPDASITEERAVEWQPGALDPGAAIGDGTNVRINPGDIVDRDAPVLQRHDTEPPAFVPYEKAPEAVRPVYPAYPDLALRAELEGTVIVRMWVTKEGRVRKAEALKFDAEIFRQPALDAAMQWVFTPALQHEKPVDVWVAVPFRFTLKDARH
jgi:TonB family protein